VADRLKMNETSIATNITNTKNTSMLDQRLQGLGKRIAEPGFLAGVGLGNEINFHIFDYDPEHEPIVQQYLPTLLGHLRLQSIEPLSIHLFEVMQDILKGRDLLEKSLELERKKGSLALENALKNVLSAAAIAKHINQLREQPHNLLLVSGVGAAFPLLRSHTLLNQLQTSVKEPLVLFFPGRYNGQRLELFGEFEDDNYYRAFPIIPRKSLQK
jgi:hypothetical protein